VLLVALSALVAQIEQRAEQREVVVAGIEHAPSLRNYLERQTYTVKPAPADYEAQLQKSRLGDPVVVIDAGFEAELRRGQAPLVALVSSSANQRAQAGTGRIAQLLHETTAQDLAARTHHFTYKPADTERFYEMLLLISNDAAGDRDWNTVYNITRQIDDVLPAGADVADQPLGVRDRRLEIGDDSPGRSRVERRYVERMLHDVAAAVIEDRERCRRRSALAGVRHRDPQCRRRVGRGLRGRDDEVGKRAARAGKRRRRFLSRGRNRDLLRLADEPDARLILSDDLAVGAKHFEPDAAVDEVCA